MRPKLYQPTNNKVMATKQPYIELRETVVSLIAQRRAVIRNILNYRPNNIGSTKPYSNACDHLARWLDNYPNATREAFMTWFYQNQGFIDLIITKPKRDFYTKKIIDLLDRINAFNQIQNIPNV